MEVESVIAVEKLFKSYPFYKKKKDIFRYALGSLPEEQFVALKEISFNLKSGDRLGLIGPNGSGKSTLLKILAGVLEYDGKVTVRGISHAILEAGIGLNMYLTGEEVAGRMMQLYGISSRTIREMQDEIFEFAELEKWKNRKILTYSSGMQARLLFAILTSVPADVYLVDEFIAVGDEHFVGKCKKRIMDLAKKGKALVLASHDYEMIMRTCNKAIWLKKGEPYREGYSFHVIKDFQNENFISQYPLSKTPGGEEVCGDGSLSCSTLKIEVFNNVEGIDIVGRFNFKSYKDMEVLVVIYVTRMSSAYVKTMILTTSLSQPVKIKQGSGKISFMLKNVPLGDGEYMANFAIESFKEVDGFRQTIYSAGWTTNQEVYFNKGSSFENICYKRKLIWRRK